MDSSRIPPEIAIFEPNTNFAASDNPPVIKRMKVSVWPEYDDPRIMVTYQGEFKDGSLFPQQVAFPVPLGTEMNMVCALKPPNDEHLCQLYDTQTAKDNLNISYNLPIPTYYLEYYWDGISEQSDKSFNFKYVSPYAADSLELEIQQPLKATNFKLAQSYASANSDSQGMKYYHYFFNNVTQGQVISVDATYTKPDNKPSVAKSQASSGGSGNSAAAGSSGSSPYVLIGIGAALMVAVVAGLIMFRRKPAPVHVRMTAMRTPPVRTTPPAQTRRERRYEAQRTHRQEMQQRPPGAELANIDPPANPGLQSTGAVFCSKCGTRLASDASFCHVCGAKVKGTD